MSYDENRISDLIDGGLKKQEDSIADVRVLGEEAGK